VVFYDAKNDNNSVKPRFLFILSYWHVAYWLWPNEKKVHNK
jgi:hypothetical protein